MPTYLYKCLARHETADRIAADVREANTMELTGTPSFLVGERLFLGRIPEAELDQLLRGVR
jgi:protein-disulfide isomerase